MEKDIISLIAEAEERAAAQKAQAQSEAAQIVVTAEREAQEIAKRSAAECATLRDQMIKCAQEKSVSDYEQAINESKSEAKSYADSHLEHADKFVLEIVGRLTK